MSFCHPDVVKTTALFMVHIVGWLTNKNPVTLVEVLPWLSWFPSWRWLSSASKLGTMERT